jgi:hypothetical protein
MHCSFCDKEKDRDKCIFIYPQSEGICKQNINPELAVELKSKKYLLKLLLTILT